MSKAPLLLMMMTSKDVSNNEEKVRLDQIQGSLNELVTMMSMFGTQVTAQKVKDYYNRFRPGITNLEELQRLIKEGKIHKLEHYNSISNFSDEFH